MSEARVAVDSFILALTTAATTSGIYPPSHPQTRATRDRVLQALDTVLSTGDAGRVTLLLVDDELAVDGRPWNRASPSRSGLVRALGRAGVESLTIRAGATAEELEALVRALAGGRRAESSDHVVLGHVAVTGGGSGGSGAVAALEASIESRLDATHAALATFRHDLREGFQRLERTVWSLIEATARDSRSFVLLASIKGDEDRLWRHAVNVCLYATRLGRALGLEGSLLHDLAVGALLHDVGYHLLDGEVAELTAQERRLHPQLGAAHLSGIDDMPSLAILIAYEHHVHWDGGGYPQTTWRPNLASQITAVADTWDMLLQSSAPGPRALRAQRAAAALRRLAGASLNPDLVPAFLEIVDAAGP